MSVFFKSLNAEFYPLFAPFFRLAGWVLKRGFQPRELSQGRLSQLLSVNPKGFFFGRFFFLRRKLGFTQHLLILSTLSHISCSLIHIIYISFICLPNITPPSIFLIVSICPFSRCYHLSYFLRIALLCLFSITFSFCFVHFLLSSQRACALTKYVPKEYYFLLCVQ